MMPKYALIIGSSKGIGRSIAIELAKVGFDIFVHYNTDKDSADKVANEITALSQNAYVINGDVSNPNDVTNMFKKILDITDTLDLVVNNAAIDFGKLIEDTSPTEMQKIIHVDLLGPMYVTKSAFPFLKNAKTAQIINIASRMGKERTAPTTAFYGAAKAGLIKFSQVTSKEWAQHGIRVNVINPALTDTEMTRAFFSQEHFDKAAANNPMKRLGTPEDIAYLAVFLASDKATYINGETIGVNGGSNLI